MKRVFIVHCWEGNPDYCWYPSVKADLEKQGFQVNVPAMPETAMPKQSLWVPRLKELIGRSDADTFLVGHSIGCAAIMRYLEQLGDGQEVGGVVFVAGFTDDLGFPEIHNFFETPLNFSKIRSSSRGFIAIHSDNDPFVDLHYSEVLNEQLGAEIVLKSGKKHFSGPVDNEESCVELREVVEAVVAFAK